MLGDVVPTKPLHPAPTPTALPPPTSPLPSPKTPFYPCAWLELAFDGSIRPNPGGKGGWGVVCHAFGDSTAPPTSTPSRPHLALSGSVCFVDPDSNLAEYLALIQGLRAIHRALGPAQAAAVCLMVVGDSSTVVQAMRSALRSATTPTPTPPAFRTGRLHRLRVVAESLLRRFGFVQVSRVPRQWNAAADRLAAAGGERGGVPPEACAVFWPAGGAAVVKARVRGCNEAVMGSVAMDRVLEGRAEWSMVDAGFLTSDKVAGLRVLEGVEDPAPIEAVVAAVGGASRGAWTGGFGTLRMPEALVAVPAVGVTGTQDWYVMGVLGVLPRLEMRLEIPAWAAPVVLERVLVVEELPVPLHVALPDTARLLRHARMDGAEVLGREAFPQEFRRRTFWQEVPAAAPGPAN
ncbi:hypothetical protein HDU96_010935 [Phlyctochytrium bullatum]|nr:hypothetical protein HDU96_010935 [Phlyctochytrium bullatum]